MKVSFKPEGIGQFAWQTTFQQDDRRENRIRRMNHSDIPTVSLHLRSLQNALTWSRCYSQWKSEAGIQLINTDNHNERGTGVVPIIPNYTDMALGVYALQRYTANRWGMEGGIRLDGQQTKADGYDWTGSRYGGKRNFTNFTYSLGGHYHLSLRWMIQPQRRYDTTAIITVRGRVLCPTSNNVLPIEQEL